MVSSAHNEATSEVTMATTETDHLASASEILGQLEDNEARNVSLAKEERAHRVQMASGHALISIAESLKSLSKKQRLHSS